MNTELKKIAIAKYVGLITKDQGHWYYENTGSLKYDDDWNWIMEAYKRIGEIEDERAEEDRLNLGQITLGIISGCKQSSFDALYDFVIRKNYNLGVLESSDLMPFGKHKGKQVSEIIKKDIRYIRWIYDYGIIPLSDEINQLFIEEDEPGFAAFDDDDDFADFLFCTK